MKILVVGSGGREHALAWKLSQEAEVVAAPGNPGIAGCARCVDVATSDHAGLIDLAKSEAVDLVVVGPEDPLIHGLADVLRKAGLLVFGPGADGAELEGSKAFSKQLMREAGVLTADFEVFGDPASANDYIRAHDSPVVVKASGAALGKGVIVTDSKQQAHDAIEAIMMERIFGGAGETVVVEDRLSGPEFSLLTLCSDVGIFSLPVAQDYKRILDGDRGPNTGGMGSYSPVPWIDRSIVRETENTVVRPILEALRKRGISYRGVLYSGLMMCGSRAYCLEFNVRFGDPETQSVMLRLGKGLAGALMACAAGEAIPPVEVLDNAAVSVVLASGGYPNDYEKGKPITIGSMPPGVQAFQAGTKLSEAGIVTNGGRVMAISASGSDLTVARSSAYEGVSRISFEGMQFRKDIAFSTPAHV